LGETFKVSMMTELSLFNVSGNSFGYLYLGYSVGKKTELIRFRFYKSETKNTKKTRKKPS